MFKLLNIITLVSIFSINVAGQKGYYATDTTKIAGVDLVKGDPQYCRVKSNGKIIKFSSEEIKEYGYKDGKVFFSREIQLTVFLERLVNGNTNLYYYKNAGYKTFFIEKDSAVFIELPKNGISRKDNNYRDNLLNLTSDCPQVIEGCKHVGYNKKSLSKIITLYNKCEFKQFPFLRYGLIAGYGATKLIPYASIDNDYLRQIGLNYDWGFMFGLFIDKPIQISNFSIHAELYYSQHEYSYYENLYNNDIDFIANISTLNLPVLVRYTIPTLKIKPYFNAGGYYAYNLKNEGAIYETTIDQNTIVINSLFENSLIAKTLIGYSIGGGIEYKLTKRNSIFFEFRYNNLYGLSNSESMNNSEINFFTGINF